MRTREKHGPGDQGLDDTRHADYSGAPCETLDRVDFQDQADGAPRRRTPRRRPHEGVGEEPLFDSGAAFDAEATLDDEAD